MKSLCLTTVALSATLALALGSTNSFLRSDQMSFTVDTPYPTPAENGTLTISTEYDNLERPVTTTIVN